MKAQWLRETEAYPTRKGDVVSWEDAAEGLGGFPELEDNPDMEMEM